MQFGLEGGGVGRLKESHPKAGARGLSQTEAGPKRGEAPLPHLQPWAPRLQESSDVCCYGLELHDGRCFHQDSLGHIWRPSIQRDIFIHSDPVSTFFFSFNMESSSSSVLPFWSPLLHPQEEDRHSFALLQLCSLTALLSLSCDRYLHLKGRSWTSFIFE